MREIQKFVRAQIQDKVKGETYNIGDLLDNFDNVKSSKFQFKFRYKISFFKDPEGEQYILDQDANEIDGE